MINIINIFPFEKDTMREIVFELNNVDNLCLFRKVNIDSLC